MADKISTIDPRSTPEWEAFVCTRSDATVFHSTAWCSVITGTYGYPTNYLVSSDAAGRITGGIPLMLVDSWLSSRRLVGLPFSDLCAPLLPPNKGDELITAALAEAGKQRAGSVELRGPLADSDGGFASSSSFYRHVIDLDDEIECRLHSSARRAVRKAEKEGLSVRVSTDSADMRRFYELMVMTRRKHGLLPQPPRFFKQIDTHFLKSGLGWLLLAEYEGNVVAGDLLLRFQDELVYKFNASDPKFLHLRPNNLLLWQAILFGKEAGCRTLDLGRCELDNDGLRRFKMLWGSREEQLSYYQWSKGALSPGILASSKARSALALLVKFAPKFVLETAGTALYRSFG